MLTGMVRKYPTGVFRDVGLTSVEAFVNYTSVALSAIKNFMLADNTIFFWKKFCK